MVKVIKINFKTPFKYRFGCIYKTYFFYTICKHEPYFKKNYHTTKPKLLPFFKFSLTTLLNEYCFNYFCQKKKKKSNHQRSYRKRNFPTNLRICFIFYLLHLKTIFLSLVPETARLQAFFKIFFFTYFI